jgi:6-phosphofructokinase 2
MQAVTLTVNPALDKSTSVDHVVVDRKLRCAAPAYDPGGGGINVARVLHTLGTDVTAVFPAGGPSGGVLADMLHAEGLNIEPIPISGWTRENFNVRELVSNQQYRFTLPGPVLSAHELEACVDAVLAFDPVPRYIVLSGSLPPGATPRFFADAARRIVDAGSLVVLDTSGEPLRLAAEEGAHLIKPNLAELESLVGHELPTEAQQEDAARSVLERGTTGAVVVSLGAGGALLVTHDGATRLRAPTVRVQSRVGAGDSMVGGIVHGLLQGKSFLDAGRLGIAAGSATVMSEGTQLCRREDVERLTAELARAS